MNHGTSPLFSQGWYLLSLLNLTSLAKLFSHVDVIMKLRDLSILLRTLKFEISDNLL